MREFSEKAILEYMESTHGYATDNDFHLYFIPKESDAYFKLHMEINLLVRRGKLVPTSGGYKLKDDK